MSTMLIHHNETIFPDPLKFDPQRWMGEKKRQQLERYLVNFSKGTRSCAGIKYVPLITNIFASLFVQRGLNGVIP